MTVISVVNEKGGVGKTTTCIEVGSALNSLGYRVLLVDLDQQCNLSAYCGILGSGSPSIYEVLNAEASIGLAVRRLEWFDAVQGSGSLSRAEKDFSDMEDCFLLSDALGYVRDDYDFVMLDNPPNRGVMQTMSLVAADWVVLPTECDEGSISGVRSVLGDVGKMKGGRLHISHAGILGIILTKAENTKMHEIVLEELKVMADGLEPPAPFVMTVRKEIAVSECKRIGEPLRKYKASGRAAKDYMAVAEEIARRVNNG